MVDSIAYRGLFYKRAPIRVFAPPSPPAPTFSYAAQNWAFDFEGDNRTNSTLVGTPSAGTSDTLIMTSTGANIIAAGGTFNAHASIDWNSDAIWSSGQFVLSDIISASEFTLFAAIDVKSISALGTEYHDVPRLIGDGGGGAYWGIGVYNDGVDDLLIAGCHDGGFKHVTIPITTGKHVVAFRLKAGTLSISVDNGAFQTTTGIGSVAVLTNYLTNDGSNGKADLDVARISTSPIGFTDANVQQAVYYLGTRYGITVAAPDVPVEPGSLGVAYVFIITGQSLSAGNAAGDPVQTPVTLGPITGHYQFDNLWNDGYTAIRTPSADWSMVAAKNPMRQEGANNNFYPFNTYYETPHAAMAEKFGELGLSPTCWTHVGRNAIPYSGIKKGGSQPSYAGSLTELDEWVVRLVALGHSRVVVAGIVLIHGESDLGDAAYGPTYLPELQSDYDSDCKAITGQTEDIPLYYNQPSAAWPTNSGSYNDIHEQMLTAHNGTTLVCVGPKYAVEYNTGDIHLVPSGTRRMGQSMATAIMEHRASGFSPLQPLSASQVNSHDVEVLFTGTDSASIEMDSTWWDSNHTTNLTEWSNGYGFELSDNTGRLTISDVVIDGSTAIVSTTGSIGTSPVISYAYLADGDSKPRRGQLRTTTGYWCSHFTRAVTPFVGGFDITSLAWEAYLLGDNLNADYQIDAVAVGNSAGRHFRATSDDSLAAGGAFGIHDSVDLQSKEMWSVVSPTWTVDDIVSPTSWSFVCIADLQSFSAIGSSYYDTPTLFGAGGGSVYWGIGVANIGGSDKIVAGAYDGGFYDFTIPASTGKQVIQWRCVAGVMQMRVNKNAWTTGPTITDITLRTGRLDTDMGAGKANADVAFYGVSKTAFDDATFDDICDLAAADFGVTL